MLFSSNIKKEYNYMRKYAILLSTLLLIGTQSFAETKSASSVITDKKNMIYWQDNPSSKATSEDWDDAILYCKTLEINGKKNWRLPTFDELLSIVDYSRVNPAINPIFEEVAEGTYWTATNFSPTDARAWTIHFSTGKSYYSYKTTNHAVRCVKDIK